MPSGSSSPRRSGSNKNSSSPLLHSLLRTAVSALASDSTSKDRHSSHRSGSSHSYPEPGHLPRSHTQPEPRRHGDYDSATGIPSHTAPSTSKDHTFQLLKTAAYELGKLVSDVEGKIKPTDKDKYRPSHIRSDDDRFEEVSDTETTISEQERRRHRNRDSDSRSGGKSSSSRKHRERARSAESGRHREHHRGGHADAYYGYSASGTPPTAPGQFGYNDYTQQFNPAAQTHSYPYPPPAPAPQQYNLNHNDSYTHPLPSPQPMYDESSERPQLKRSKTSASRFAGEMGGELMKNLPALLDKAAWLLGLLEKKNAASGNRGLGSGGHSALLMALGLVMELYRSLGGADKIRSYNEKRAMKKERMGERY